MKKPTQAQIVAAAIAICKSKTCEGINCCQWPANGGRRRDNRGQPVQCNAKVGAYDDAAKAALTAAAEVGEPEAGRLRAALEEIACHYIDSDLASREKRNMACRALGRNTHPAYAYAVGAKIEEIEAATIERCAMVIEEHDRHAWDTRPETLAAAIRALKDKP